MSNQIRIGGPVFAKVDTPEQLVRHLREQGFAAAYHPRFDDPTLLREAVAALAEADIVIAETGAFGINVLDPDAAQRERNVAAICRRLESAESVGSLCCVAHGGWAGGNSFNKHYPENFSQRSIANLVAAVQRIIDTVQPQRTRFVLETESRYLPDSADVYLEIMDAVDRPAFGAHLDPVNITSSPRRFYGSGDFIRDCFAKLGPHLVSCHAKDIQMPRHVQVRFDETFAGNGSLDYQAYLAELAKLDADVPLMIEHVNARQLRWATDYLCEQAARAGVAVRHGERRVTAPS